MCNEKEYFELEAQARDITNEYIETFNRFLADDTYAASLKYSVITSLAITLLTTAYEMDDDLFAEHIEPQLNDVIDGKIPSALNDEGRLIN